MIDRIRMNVFTKGTMNTSLPHARLISTAPYFILVVLFAFAGRPATAQEAKPNLTGTWNLNLAKSKLADAHPHRSDSYEIKHQEPKIVVVHNFGASSETFFYVVDGKERLARLGSNGDQIRAKAMWEGASLVLEKRQTLVPRDTLWTSRYTLSEDGKSLVITHHVKQSTFGSPGDEWLVYDKK
jgi:hypothetical protein